VSSTTGFDAAALAAEWLERGGDSATVLCDLSQQDAVALLWALKDRALQSWMNDAPMAERCDALAQHVLTVVSSNEALGIAEWIRGFSRLTQGDMPAAISHLDGADRMLTSAGKHLAAAQSQVPKLVALSMLNRHDDALQCAQRTHAAFLSLGDEFGAGKIELNLGSLFMQLDQYAKAAEQYKRAAVRFARLSNVEYSIHADIGLANALARQFDFDEAIRLYERSSMRIRSRGLDALQSVIDSNRGALELQRGRYEHALPALVSALRRAETHEIPQVQADSQRELADAYLALNLLPEAMALYDQSIAICEQLDAPVELAWAKIQRAQALARLGDAERAQQGLQEALSLLSADGNLVAQAMARMQLATLALGCGEPARSLDHARHAAAAFEQARVLGWQLGAELLQARALSKLGQAEPARQLLQSLLLRCDGLPELAAAAHVAQGELASRTTATPDRAAARHHFEQAVTLLTAQQARLDADEFKTAYGADKQAAFDALVRLALDEARPDRAARVFQAMEQSRTQALRAAIEAPQRHGGSGVVSLDQRRREQLRWLQSQWQEAIHQGDNHRARGLREQIAQTEQHWLEEQRRTMAAAASQQVSPSGAEATARPLDVAKLQSALSADTAWVEYALLGDTWAACVVTPHSVHAVQGDCTGLATRLEQLRFQINTLRFGAPALRTHVAHAAQMTQRSRQHLHALHTMLWAPIAPLVAGFDRVIVAPHRSLHYLPFCALHDGQHWLVQRHQLQLAPSASIWLAGHQAHVPAPSGLQRLVAMGLGGEELPHVRAEVQAVAAAFEAHGSQAVVHLDDAATQTSLRASLPGTDVLHLACHGQFRADSPYFSALHLADGPLTLRDAASLPIKARLVTLSACETGLSKVAPGDELLGLLRGFLMAGAPTVLTTLWTVDDAHTATLMGRFYRDLLAGARPAAALQAAQCELLEQVGHPYHWAAFALHGQG
jgi:CHAT domain-containing protein/tetratricopeptide (TPR) repeat protein